VLGQLNAALRPHGLFFPVDPSTHSRCTIGGMAGNNSCGSKSIRYGLMADNVQAIEAILPDGTRARFGPTDADAPADLLAKLRAIGTGAADEIAARMPTMLRRVGGYNIDALTPAARAVGRGNMARLLIGSEGTLAFSTSLLLSLVPIKPRKTLGICQFPTFRAAMEATKHLVALDPEAVELVDRTMIDLGRSIPIYRATIDRMLIGEPDSLLIVEFHAEDDATLDRAAAALDTAMVDLGYPGQVVHARDAAFQGAVASVREAGLNIMMSMKGDAKPVSFIEDAAVPLDDLADYTERLTQVFDRHGVKGTWYAHASVGCLHVRPVLNMKDPADIATMRTVAEECFALVRAYKGSHSGEHGDGIVRSEFLAPMLGPRIVAAFEAVKDAIDPDGLMNPGRIVRPPRMDDRTLFRYPPDYGADASIVPLLDWSDHPNGLLGAAEMCNNNGTCRGFDASVMCPSYRVTRDEQHVTRGRANTLRLALSGQLGPNALASDALADAMALCVSCKACRRECPTGVDMARMKIEVLAARRATHGTSLRDRLIAHLPDYARAAGRVGPLVAAVQRLGPVRRLMERHLGLSASRDLPAFRADWFRDSEGSPPNAPAPRGDVLLLADSFNRYLEPENLRAAVRVLTAGGWRVRVAASPAGGRPLCCGRTFLAAGMVERARSEAARLRAAVVGDAPVVGLEPSCLMTLRDEVRALLPGPASDALAGRAVLIGELLAKTRPTLPFAPTLSAPNRPARLAHVHGHCHQKSFGAFPDALTSLGLVPGLEARPIQSSCCGMAGAFGYAAEHQEISRAMAEQGVLPAVRAAADGDLIVADGTSCRHQIADLSGRLAVHSVRVIADALAPG
jgi:FAD/FMN-containing dehydrogenase/Fe-S oxidoreductase